MSAGFKRESELDLRGKRVLIRADLNAPIEGGRLMDDARLRASLPGISMALAQNAAVMVTSHLGRPKEGELRPGDSLAPVAGRLAQLLGMDVPLISGWTEKKVEVAPGQVVMLENCRVNKGEKKDDEALSRRIASMCDIYVNDAFGTAHRAEATTHGVARFAPVACAGPLMAAELDALRRALADPARPMVAIVGGAKVSTKLGVLAALVAKVDWLMLGGAMANTFLFAKGLPIGKSLAEPALAGEARAIMTSGRVLLPVDVVVAKDVDDEWPKTKLVEEVQAGEMIVDIGPRSLAAIEEKLAGAGTVLWNGPVGMFEREAFCGGTRRLAASIADSRAYSIAGGGETVAAIAKYCLERRISYVSSGGGAFLEYVAGRTLPAVTALEARAHG